LTATAGEMTTPWPDNAQAPRPVEVDLGNIGPCFPFAIPICKVCARRDRCKMCKTKRAAMRPVRWVPADVGRLHAPARDLAQ
jgi:hypothetical protein